jgi:hypothetical protein
MQAAGGMTRPFHATFLFAPKRPSPPSGARALGLLPAPLASSARRPSILRFEPNFLPRPAKRPSPPSGARALGLLPAPSAP